MRQEAISVRHYGPGGCEQGGGIGRFIGYVVDAAPAAARHVVTDTRGPRWSVPASPLRLALAMLSMAGDRMVAPRRIHHIHLAGRGSTSRKLLLTGVARALGCRHVLHLHDYDYAGDFAARSPRGQSRVRRMFGGADAVVVLGRHDRRLAVDRLGADPLRVHLLHNCVPDPGEPQLISRARAARREGPTILFLGRLSERKGVPELLEALADPEMLALPWRAILAGDGPVDSYRARAQELGLAGRVEMPGWLAADATAALCREADILVLPSHAEGLAMAVLEGLAHQLAVVTTRVGAHEEAITDGATGCFVPVGDVAALRATLAGLVRDPGRRAAIARNGRALFLSRFSMAALMPRLSDLYETVAARGEKRPQGRSV